MTATLVALGDSMSCGEGVGVRVPLHLTWPALLAQTLALQHVSYARPGARAHDVLTEQVGPAAAAQPSVVTLLIGLNDVLRSSNCVVGPLLTETLAAFGTVPSGTATLGTAPVLLVVRLHDPTLPLSMPRRARAAVRRRVSLINAAVDQAAAVTGAQVLDLAALPALGRREAWAVDRMHPSLYGHAVIAAAAAARLGDGDALLGDGDNVLGEGDTVQAEVALLALATSTRLAELAWLSRHGVPYLAVHGRRMVPGVVAGLARR